MLTIIASLAGFLSSLLPLILQIFRERSNNSFKVALIDKQIELQRAALDQKVNIQQLISSDNISNTLYQYTYNSGIKFLDFINGLVRPLMAYSFMLLYGGIKYFNYQILVASGDMQLLPSIWWNEEDQAIFASILSFYFGNRCVAKMKR